MAFSAEKNKAIKAFCLDCCGGSHNEVKLCPSKTCPLFPFRIGSIKAAGQIDGVDYEKLFNSKKQRNMEDFDENID